MVRPIPGHHVAYHNPYAPVPASTRPSGPPVGGVPPRANSPGGTTHAYTPQQVNSMLNTRMDPNATFQVDGLRYHTDGQGRPSRVSGEVQHVPMSRRNRTSTHGQSTQNIGKGPHSQAGDVGFHIVGAQFGGLVNSKNVVPGNGSRLPSHNAPNLNQGVYKKIEARIAAIARQYPQGTQIRASLDYTGSSTTRPDTFTISYWANGTHVESRHYHNQPGG